MPRALAVCLLLPTLGFCAAKTSHLDFREEAAAAYQRKDYAAALEATREALALRPDSPRYLYNLAALCALTADEAGAIEHLRRLAAMGVVMPIERDPDFARLQGTPEFFKILRLFAANAEPRGQAELIAELPGRTGIIEGIAYRPRTGELFLSDVHHRCIWKRDRTGQVTRFTAEDDELLGMFGVAIDEARNALWVAMAAQPEMVGFTSEFKGQAALVELNLATSDIRRVVPIPNDGREHGLGDLLIAPDGTVYASDSLAPVIWRLVPGAEEVDKVIDSPVFSSLQGMVLSDRTLLVADYANGLFAIDIPTGNITALTPPPNATLLGIDGLISVPDGVIAIQNGVQPERVLRLALSPDFRKISDVTVLAAALPNLKDLTLATLINDQPTVIAGSGWEGFDPNKAKQPAAHTVRIFQLISAPP